MRLADLSGKRFGRLVVLTRAANRGTGTYWNCACDCGERKTVSAIQLSWGKTRSCGCLRREMVAGKNFRHGASGTPEHIAYKAARNRCNNKAGVRYHEWGGRGIRFKFPDFKSFLAEVGARPSPMHSLGRIDNDGHYEPGNVRWETRKEQNANTAQNQMMTFRGETLCAAEWARRLGIAPKTMHARLRLGWSHQKALTEPLRPDRRRR